MRIDCSHSFNTHSFTRTILNILTRVPCLAYSYKLTSALGGNSFTLQWESIIHSVLTHILTNYSHSYNSFTAHLFTQFLHAQFYSHNFEHFNPSVLSSILLSAIIVFASTTFDSISSGWKIFHAVLRLSWIFQLNHPGSVPSATIYLCNFEQFNPKCPVLPIFKCSNRARLYNTRWKGVTVYDNSYSESLPVIQYGKLEWPVWSYVRSHPHSLLTQTLHITQHQPLGGNSSTL